MNFAGAHWAPVSNFPVVIALVNAIVSMTVQFMAVTRWGPDARTHVLLGATYSPLKDIEYGGRGIWGSYYDIGELHILSTS